MRKRAANDKTKIRPTPRVRCAPLCHKSQAANRKSRITISRITARQSALTNRAFLMDIWRLETAVTRWKHTMRVRSNRHVVDTPPSAVFAARNVVSAPRRVLASRFSALGGPSLWRNPRVHRAYPPGGGIVMLIPMHSTKSVGRSFSTRNACLGAGVPETLARQKPVTHRSER